VKFIPFALIFASAIFCSTIRNKIDPTPTPLPTLGEKPLPTQTSSPTPTRADDPTPDPSAANSLGTTISGGVLNGKAKSMPKPEYPAAAKAVRASGSVNVEVLVDQQGKVVTATAISGHPLLRQAAVAAAKLVEFSPTLLSGKAVKVKGMLTYNFVPE